MVGGESSSVRPVRVVKSCIREALPLREYQYYRAKMHDNEYRSKSGTIEESIVARYSVASIIRYGLIRNTYVSFLNY